MRLVPLKTLRRLVRAEEMRRGRQNALAFIASIEDDSRIQSVWLGGGYDGDDYGITAVLTDERDLDHELHLRRLVIDIDHGTGVMGGLSIRTTDDHAREYGEELLYQRPSA